MAALDLKRLVGTRRALVLGGGLAAAATAGVAACGPNGLLRGGTAQPPLAQRPPTTLEFWGGPNSDQRQSQIDLWHQKYPKLRVSFRTDKAVGAGIEAMRLFAGAVAAGKAPHVLDFDRFQVAAYVNWRMFRPVDDYLRRDRYDLSPFAPAVLGEATGLDKKLYGLPSSVDNRLLYWNKQHFAEAGLDPDKPPRTWDDLKSFGARLTRWRGGTAIERIGFHTQEGQSTLHLFAWQNGGGFQSADGKAATLALPANQEALQAMVGVLNEQGGWGPAAAFRNTWGVDGRHAFLVGQASMQYQINNWAGEMIARLKPNMEFGVAPPVKRVEDTSTTWSGGFSYLMGHNVRDPDVGWELIKWLVGEEAWTAAYDSAVARARAVGGVYVPGMTGQPALDKKLAPKYRTGLAAVDLVPDVAVDLMQRTRYREPSIAAADLWEGIVQAQEQAVSQAKSPRQALEEHNARVQRALDQAWVFAPPK